jgi:hypothetical protein
MYESLLPWPNKISEKISDPPKKSVSQNSYALPNISDKNESPLKKKQYLVTV